MIPTLPIPITPPRQGAEGTARPFRLAVQKRGRLTDDSLQLLRDCGLDLATHQARLLVPATTMPVEVLFLRDDDIGDYVRSGVADAGLLGENVVHEQGTDSLIVRRLGFGRCRLSLAVPRGAVYDGPASLAGLRVATTYPRLLAAFLERHGVQADIHELRGSVEVAPAIGLADAICDLVSSGSTLFSNGLREVETILPSQAVLIARPDLPPPAERLLQTLLFRIDAVQRASDVRYILLNAPTASVDAISALLPGLQSPTVMPLARQGWCSIHSVIPADGSWDIIDRVRALGAEGILVTTIEKVVA